MKTNAFSFWKIIYYISFVGLIIGTGVSIIITDQTILKYIIGYSAKFGMFALAFLFTIKNIALAHKKGTNVLIDFLRKQLRWQREQGLIAFNAFALHALSTASFILLHSELNIGEYFYTVFTALIPASLMVYLFLTSFKPVQKKLKNWKSTHSLGWILFGTILIHEFLASQTFHTTTIIATIIAIGSLLYGLFVQSFNKRSKKQLLFASIGFVLMGGMFLINNLVRKPLLNIGLDQSDTKSETKLSVQTEVIEQPQVKEVTKKYNDGTFEGVADGHYGQIGLSVVIQNDKIQAITVTRGEENSNYVRTLTSRVIEKQGTDVAAISGATRTTTGVKNAIDNALKQATI